MCCSLGMTRRQAVSGLADPCMFDTSNSSHNFVSYCFFFAFALSFIPLGLLRTHSAYLVQTHHLEPDGFPRITISHSLALH